MQVLLAEVRRMGSTLNELLSFSRPVTSLASARVHLASLLGEVVVLHEGLALKEGVTMRVDPGDALPVFCDPRKVKQVITNLLQNALWATPRGGLVTLRTAHGTGRTARILVEDTGPGLAPQVRDRLFVPGVTTKPEGSGIGLVIARAIAEQHGGSLSLVDRPEGGCVAELILPLDPPPGGDSPQAGDSRSHPRAPHPEDTHSITPVTDSDGEVPT